MAAAKVNIINSQKVIKIPTGTKLLVKKCCIATLQRERFPHNVEVSISFTDNEGIRELNSSFRNKNIATDVLSFPMASETEEYAINPQSGSVILGDAVISIEKALAQAYLYGHSLQREIAFLTVHAMLHLLGYDHENSTIEAANMQEITEEILYSLGLMVDAV